MYFKYFYFSILILISAIKFYKVEYFKNNNSKNVALNS